MKYLTALKKWWRELDWLERSLLIWIALIAVGRWINLTSPQAVVFDEVYFPKMASQYLAGESFFDIHPPLGKLLIALGIQSFGDSYLGWRVVPAIFGTILPVLAYRLTRVFSGSRLMGLILALFLLTDGLFVVYARLGLMDEIMITFGLLALIFSGR
ncbi:MAG: dolichyl-phosphate-mannose-protein mannosyltransferase, partial [Candidatus Berkelbacteria bacterium Gr01-1014_85]